MIRTVRNMLSGVVLAATLLACGGATEQAEVRDNTQEVLDYYAAHPDLFQFKTLADLPADLVWERGEGLPDLGSPDAKKGGTQYGSIQDFPRTLRYVGPDSNGAFRTWILDDVTLPLALKHPDTDYDFYPALASEWALDEENGIVYARLDPAARWSDGEAITVDDFMFMFFFNRSEYIVAHWYNNYYNITFSNITKYDDHTLSVTMNTK
ncbi:MAG: ABC transporter substrate-binding protein, partial [Pseudohongiella sp.]|nr:ABC transporter substrate-binding protein [Pseudohongiella sp.]